MSVLRVQYNETTRLYLIQSMLTEGSSEKVDRKFSYNNVEAKKITVCFSQKFCVLKITLLLIETKVFVVNGPMQ
jgi:hypothetical protein